MSRLIAIGDVHGASRSLNSLLEKIQPQRADHLVFLGDVIDYGIDTQGVIDILIRLSKQCSLSLILGNHEEVCLQAIDDLKSGSTDRSLERWLGMGGQSTMDSYDGATYRKPLSRQHIEFLKTAVNFVETEQFIFVHAYVSEQKRLEEMPGEILRWKFIPENPVRHFSGKTVIVGHTRQDSGNVLDLGFLVGIDTGSGIKDDGWLTAFDLTNSRFYAANEYGQVRQYFRQVDQD
jgi:serine/threonine protein phosphatase 1